MSVLALRAVLKTIVPCVYQRIATLNRFALNLAHTSQARFVTEQGCKRFVHGFECGNRPLSDGQLASSQWAVGPRLHQHYLACTCALAFFTWVRDLMKWQTANEVGRAVDYYGVAVTAQATDELTCPSDPDSTLLSGL